MREEKRPEGGGDKNDRPENVGEREDCRKKMSRQIARQRHHPTEPETLIAEGPNERQKKGLSKRGKPCLLPGEIEGGPKP